MTGRRYACAVLGCLAAGLAAAGCGGGAAGGGASSLTVEPVYAGTGTPRAVGLARAAAAAEPDRSPDSIADLPGDTWLRLTVEGPDFHPIVCQFPKPQGGRCEGIPAGAGRIVTVEEWNSSFDTLYFRGRAVGVQIAAGRDTRIAVELRPPVTIRYPQPGAALNRRAFDVLVQADPHATVQLYLGTNPVGHTSADANGIAAIHLDGPGTAPPAGGEAGGLEDGFYLLTAVAFPGPPASEPGVRHLGAPVAFEVDLRPPALEISAPTLTGGLAVDLEGITEPGAVVRCGAGDPADGQPLEVPEDGRFRFAAVPISPPATDLACLAADRAGNTTLRTLTVAHLPDGFTVEAALPSATNQPEATLDVRTDPIVDDLLIEVTGSESPDPLVSIVADTSGTGSFTVPVTLHANQWNRVRIAARVAGIVLGQTEVAIEHDDIPPDPPVAEWHVTRPGNAEWDPTGNPIGGAVGYFQQVILGFEPFDAGIALELYRAPLEERLKAGSAEPFIVPENLALAVDGTSGYLTVPSGYCSFLFPVIARDRAGNRSSVNDFALYPVGYYCVR